MNINNQHQQVLWYLLNFKKFTLTDVIKDSMFHKFQTRLSEIEKEYGILAKRETYQFINRFGRTSSGYIYTCIDSEKVKSIYNLMTRIKINQ